MRTALLGIVLTLLLDPLNAATYYVSPQGNDLNPGTQALSWRTIQKAADTLVAGDTVYIRAGTYAEAVAPQSSGLPGAYITYAAYPGETPTIDGSTVTLGTDFGLIEVTRKSFIRISGLRVTRSGPYPTDAGIIVDESSDIIIENNSTYDTASSGIGVWASRNVTLRANDVRLACNHRGWEECISMASTDGFEIVNNTVHDGSLDPVGGEGICIKQGSANGTVHGNDVHGLVNRLAIYIDGWDSYTHGIRIYGNILHDTELEGISVSSEMGGTVEDIWIYDNIAYNTGSSGISLAYWGDPTVAKRPVRRVRIVNNTVVNCGARTWAGGISMENPDASDVVIRNNIVADNFAFQINSGFAVPGLLVDHNLIRGFRGTEPTEIRGTEAQEADPQFANAPVADFHLGDRSPAIDNGSSVDAPSADFDGRPRPQGKAFDIGAYEYPWPTVVRRRAVKR